MKVDAGLKAEISDKGQCKYSTRDTPRTPENPELSEILARVWGDTKEF